MAIPQSFIQELVSRADIVEIVGRSVQLKKGGANYMGLCPFHSEKSPSFSVSPSKQFYHCFGCGKNGNVISFLIENNGMTFLEAVQDLAQQFGMQIPEDDATPQDRERAAQQRAGSRDIHQLGRMRLAVAAHQHRRLDLHARRTQLLRSTAILPVFVDRHRFHHLFALAPGKSAVFNIILKSFCRILR